MNLIIIELVIGLIFAIVGVLGSFGLFGIGTIISWILVGIGFILLIVALLQNKKKQ